MMNEAAVTMNKCWSVMLSLFSMKLIIEVMRRSEKLRENIAVDKNDDY